MGRSRAEGKWLRYAGLLLLLWFLERCVLNRLPLGGLLPWLTPLGVAALGFWEGSYVGAVWGVAAGLLTGLTGSTGGAALIWQEMLIGIACGTTRNKALGRTLLGYLLCALGSLLFLEGGQILVRACFLGQELAAVCRIAGGEGLCSLAFAPLIYPAFRWVSRRFGTEMEF